jgi:hypothetical protein
MSVELYIQSLYWYDQTSQDFIGNEPLGYFRDNDNASSMLNTCGLSWWEDILPQCDQHGLLHQRDIEWFREELARSEQYLPSREELLAWNIRLEETGLNSVDGWHAYYIEKKERLLVFLTRALHRGEPIRCSLSGFLSTPDHTIIPRFLALSQRKSISRRYITTTCPLL